MKLKVLGITLFVLGISILSVAQVNLNNGLVLYLPFSGNANDASGNGNNAVVNGATLTTDQYGIANSAYLFNGVSDFLTVAPSASVNSLTSYTICAMVMPIDFYNGACYTNEIFSKGTTGSNGIMNLQYNSNEFWGFSCSHPFDSTHNIYNMWYRNLAFPTQGNSGLPIQPYIVKNNWDCVIVSFDSLTSRIKLFVNGTKHVDTVMGFNSGVFNSTDSIFIGKHNSTQFPYWVNGKLDEIRLYNRALNDSEVVAYCNSNLVCDTLANFTVTQSCQDFQFTDSSYANCNTITMWDWDFGDGTTSTLQNPVHSYPVGPGTYNVTLKISDSSGVLDSVTKTISVPVPPSVSAGNDTTICAGSTITLNGSGAGITTFTWVNTGGLVSDSTIANPTTAPTTTTTFTLVGVDDLTGCSDTDEVTVNVINPNLNIISSAFATSCPDDTVTLQVATGFSTYSWTPVANLSTPNSFSTLGYFDTSTMVYVQVQDTNGCVFTDSQLVQKFTRPSFDVLTTNLSCADVLFVVSNYNGAPVTNWTWDFGDGLTGTGISPTHTYASNGTFVYTCTANYGNGCTEQFTGSIQITANINVMAGPDTTICPGKSVQLLATGANTYSWIGTTLGLNNTTIPSPVASPLKTTTYMVVGSLSNGCKDTADVTITVLDETVDIITKDKLCLGESLPLDIITNVAYNNISWQPANAISNPSVTPTRATLNSSAFVKVFVLTSSGCTIADSQYVTVEPMPNFGMVVNDLPCVGNPLSISATGGGTYEWYPDSNFNNPFMPNPTYISNISQNVSVTIRGGCKDTTITQFVGLLNEGTIVDAWINDTLLGCLNTKVGLNAAGGVSYLWGPSNLVYNPTAAKTFGTVTENREFTVQITDATGCITYDTLEVQMDNRNLRFFMPNAFTPNASSNNKFGVMSNYAFDLVEFSIYDRWGAQVYSTTDLLSAWDGKYSNGEKAVTENYVWVIRGNTPCGPFQEEGTVLLME